MISLLYWYYVSPPIDQYLKFKNHCSLLCILYLARNIGVDILPRTRSGVDKESSIRAGDRGHSGSQDRSSHLANKERNGHD
jgi:hypothetical protein